MNLIRCVAPNIEKIIRRVHQQATGFCPGVGGGALPPEPTRQIHRLANRILHRTYLEHTQAAGLARLAADIHKQAASIFPAELVLTASTEMGSVAVT